MGGGTHAPSCTTHDHTVTHAHMRTVLTCPWVVLFYSALMYCRVYAAADELVCFSAVSVCAESLSSCLRIEWQRLEVAGSDSDSSASAMQTCRQASN